MGRHGLWSVYPDQDILPNRLQLSLAQLYADDGCRARSMGTSLPLPQTQFFTLGASCSCNHSSSRIKEALAHAVCRVTPHLGVALEGGKVMGWV